MAARNTSASEEFNLLDELDNENSTTQNDEPIDLLDEITEESGVAWKPATYDDQPRGIQGRVTSVFEVESTFEKDLTKKMKTAVTLKTSAGDEWSVRGYHFILDDELRKADPAVGDFVAIKYFGTRPSKKGNDMQVYKVAIRKA